MASLDNVFKQVLSKFTTRLTRQELEDFKFASLDDVLRTVHSIQKDQGRRREMMNMTRIQSFLEAMGQYGQVIEVFLNASSLLCFVWGPMKFCLQIACTWTDSFDTLLDAYVQLAENIPLLRQYQQLFGQDPRMAHVLATIYEDILDFHQVAIRLFKQSTWRQLFKSAWKDFKTTFGQILEDLARHKRLIECQGTLIELQEAQAARAFSREQFKKSEEAQSEKRYLDILNWLSAVDTIVDQEAAAKVRHELPTTGQWVLRDPKVKAWLDPTSSLVPTLWMNGIPGAGKTVLASVVVAKSLRITGVTTIYFYCSYQDIQRKTFLAVAKAFLAQLLNQHREQLLPFIHEKMISSGQVTLVSSELIVECLKLCLETTTKTYIIIDGIDECEANDRTELLTFFVSLIDKIDTPGQLRAFFVSQDLSDIRKNLRTATTLKLTEGCNKSDIESYTVHWAKRIRARFSITDAMEEYIRSEVLERAEGMFLFAKLVLTNLCAQTTVQKLCDELHPSTFPKGFDQAYARIVIRVYQNPNVNEAAVAQKVIGWVACSIRPLTWHEIHAALSIDVDGQSVNSETHRLCPDVRDICGSLVDIVPGGRVQLVHSTAKHYLVHHDFVQIHEEERKLAMLCLQYMLFDCFDVDLPDDIVQSHLVQGNYAFQDYAILHWVDHIEHSLPSLPLNFVEEDMTFGTTIKDFEASYGSTSLDIGDVPDDVRSKFIHLKASSYYATLVLLLYHTRILRTREESTKGLGDLGASIARNRSHAENLLAPGHTEQGQKDQLEQFYGTRWYKCPRHACPYFYRGFADLASRESHVTRHEKPYLCTYASCPRIHLGFSTETELKKHIRTTHPDPTAIFPKLKSKEQPKHVCEVCSKDFTRAHTLKVHKRTHANERPHKCSKCDKAFVRKHDLDRHVRNLHPAQISDANTPTSGGHEAESAS